MNIIEALRQKRNLRRPLPKHMGSNGDGWLAHEYVMAQLTENNRYVCMSESDFMAEDWEVQSTAGERLQRRIHQMELETGKTPTVLDVSESDFNAIECECMRRGIPDTARGLYQQLVVFMGRKGETRIVKASK